MRMKVKSSQVKSSFYAVLPDRYRSHAAVHTIALCDCGSHSRHRKGCAAPDALSEAAVGSGKSSSIKNPIFLSMEPGAGEVVAEAAEKLALEEQSLAAAAAADGAEARRAAGGSEAGPGMAQAGQVQKEAAKAKKGEKE